MRENKRNIAPRVAEKPVGMLPLTTVRGACPHDCPDTCGVLTEVVDQRAVAFRADPKHPVAQGWLCAKVRPYLDHVYHPGRLLYPLRRVGPKGSGQWQRISWEDALSEIAQRWGEILDRYGPQAILPYSYSGTLGLVQMVVSSARFWNRLGASQLQRSICGAAAEMAIEATLGARWSANYSDVLNSRLVLLWGHNPHSTAPHFMPWLRKAHHAGCTVVVIDPRRTPTAATADLHLAPRPGTDGVLALGLARLLVEAGQVDEAWLAAHAVGWPEFRARLREFPLERVCRETDLPAEALRRLAHLYGTLRPGVIKMADGINRNFNGGQNVRAIAALPALTGQYGKAGGGLMYSTSGYVKWNAQAVHHWADCPHPPGRPINMNRLGEALLGEVSDPPIASLFVFGANPATATAAAGKIRQGLRREDLFTVVHELFLTDTADLADLVLPATSQLEQTDLHKAYGSTVLTYNAQAIPPRGECVSNWELMGRLADAMGFDEPWLHQSPDEVIAEVLSATARGNPHFEGMTLERLKAEGFVPLRTPPIPFADGVFPTPSGKVELWCERLAAAGLDPLPGSFRRPEEPEQVGSLTLVTGASHHFVTTSFASQRGLLERAGPPCVEIHPEDAAVRGIQPGDRVRLFNARGSCELQATVTRAVRPGVVVVLKGRWSKISGTPNINHLTTDELADFAGQASYHSSRVEIERLANPSPSAEASA
jgi:anaerobic selenocysteine-containing dehydrogenase